MDGFLFVPARLVGACIIMTGMKKICLHSEGNRMIINITECIFSRLLSGAQKGVVFLASKMEILKMF